MSFFCCFLPRPHKDTLNFIRTEKKPVFFFLSSSPSLLLFFSFSSPSFPFFRLFLLPLASPFLPSSPSTSRFFLSSVFANHSIIFVFATSFSEPPPRHPRVCPLFPSCKNSPDSPQKILRYPVKTPPIDSFSAKNTRFFHTKHRTDKMAEIKIITRKQNWHANCFNSGVRSQTARRTHI